MMPLVLVAGHAFKQGAEFVDATASRNDRATLFNREQNLSTQQPPEMTGIKITSPAPDQRVPVGELKISGTSTYDSTTDCKVLVDLNDIKPFQNATGTGPDGQNDYSNWSFKYTDTYHLITEGDNEITAKLLCSDNSIKPKWHSVNITGVAVKPAPNKPVPTNILFTTATTNESFSLPSNNTQQQRGLSLEEQKLKIANPQGVKEATTTTTTNTSYPDIVLEESTIDETEKLIQEKGLPERQTQRAVNGRNQKPSTIEEDEDPTTTDSPYPDIVLEESTIDETEKLKQEKGLPERQTQELSTAGDQKPSTIEEDEDPTTTDSPNPDIVLDESTIDETEKLKQEKGLPERQTQQHEQEQQQQTAVNSSRT